ncbi:hypothetical protein [uncultured Ramlibacter sp.]|nr:hypothetical protein [uncultured Ramlibacter sp.]
MMGTHRQALRRTGAGILLVLAALLAGCGGGGDNAGTCNGSPEVCNQK